MAKKVVRITRHHLSLAQKDELKKNFGQDVEVGMVDETMPADSRAFVARFDQIAADADVVEVVLPPNLLEAAINFSKFSARGGTIIRAKMERVPRLDDEGNPVLNDKKEPVYDFIFDRYDVVEKVEVKTRPLGESPGEDEPMASGPKIGPNEVVSRIVAYINGEIEQMDKTKPTITVDLEKFKNFENTDLSNRLKRLYLDASWARVEIETWEGTRQGGKRVFKICLHAM